MTYHRDYPHLTFHRQWELNTKCLLTLGESFSLVRAIRNTPIMPQYRHKLMEVSLRKGAQSTTAIEGNTLTDEHIAKLVEGQKLPESLQYQGIEVENIINAFITLLQETVDENNDQLITPALLLRFHKMVGQNLGDHFAASPGHFRDGDVVVGTYRCPDYRDVPELVNAYCEFLRTEFRFDPNQEHDLDQFITTFVEAIVAHVYLEWIHPFGDGNGRTGRLIEFYVLSRGGNPDITLHILSNHYNATRSEYYRQLEKASKTKSLSEFIEYALIGYRDGLLNIQENIRSSQRQITWQKYVYDVFDNVEIGQKEVFKRKRLLALEIPIDNDFTLEQIPELNIILARLYSGLSEKTLQRDVNELIALEILQEHEDGIHYSANISAILKMVPKRKELIKHVLSSEGNQ
ncbi:MAG: Fic family protein [Chitinophagaceae bacterium]